MAHKTFPKPAKKDRKNLNKERSLFLEDVLLSEYYPNIAAIDNSLYQELIDRSDNRCEECGAAFPELHHVVGKRRKAHIENIAHLCKKCHKVPLGVHGNWELNLKYVLRYKNWCIDQGYSKKEIIFLMDNSEYYNI